MAQNGPQPGPSTGPSAIQAPQGPSIPPTALLPTLKDSIQTLYNILSITSSPIPPLSSATSQTRLPTEFENLATHLLALNTSAKQLHTQIPPEVIGYVQEGRNPDIYTREFAELAQRNNQVLKGKMEGFGRFAGVLGRQIGSGVPEMRDAVNRILVRTGVAEAGFYEVMEIEKEVKEEEEENEHEEVIKKEEVESMP